MDSGTQILNSLNKQSIVAAGKTMKLICTALSRVFVIPQRYILGIMGFLAIMNAYQMRTCLHVAITEMVTHSNKTSHVDLEECPDPNIVGNATHISQVQDFHPDGLFEWSEKTQGLILSSFYWGYVITHMPGGFLADTFGGKYTLSIGILLTAIFTLAIPAAARYGYGWLILCRIVTGLGEGTTFPAMNNLLAKWIPVEERSFIGSMVFAGCQIGAITGNVVTGLLLDTYKGEWSIVFYFFGVIGIVWFVLFTLLCYSEPETHPFITEKEKKYLQKSIGGLTRKELPPPPMRHILTSIPLWGLVAAQLGHDWGFFTMVTDLPKYMKDVLKFNIKQNGLLSSIPYLSMWMMSLLSGLIADQIIKSKCLSVTKVRKIFTTIAHVGPTIGIIAASYAGCDRTAVVVLFAVAMGLMGTFYPGMRVNALDLSPNYAGTLMAIVNGLGAVSGMITPYLVGVLAPNHTLVEWRTVFWIVGVVNIVTNVMFVTMGTGKVQYWNDMTQYNQQIKQKKDEEEGKTEDKTHHQNNTQL